MRHAVCLTTDKDTLYAFLQRDPVYAAYAIGDLEPAMFDDTTWYLAYGDRSLSQPDMEPAASGLALIYRGLEPPVLWTMGDAQAVAAVFGAVTLPGRIYMAAQLEHLPVFEAAYDFSGDRVRPMLRMTVSQESFRAAARPVTRMAARRLTLDDLPALLALYAGAGGPEAPDAFHPRQLAGGAFFGVESPVLAGGHPELVAVAGTHLLAPHWGVAAVGNVFTHPAWRGRGLGRQVTFATTQDLLERGLLVVLNVDRANAPAIHLYNTLGYRAVCPYVEGIATKRREL